MAPEQAWKATLGELELQMTRATFHTWLKDAHLLTCDEDTFVIGVRNDYAKDWLENRLHDTIVRTLSAVAGRRIQVRFVVWADELRHQPRPASGNGQASSAGVPPRTPDQTAVSADSRLVDRYTFAHFVVGASNRLAHAAALSVAENPGQTYNPLFIYGGVGLGKTHLLHAIGHKCRRSANRICYISSEMFTNDLVQSIRNKQMAQFRQRYRTPDVLLIDDIQFVAGKESTQEELFHTFNALHSQGKQVVLSSDRPPRAMATLEERLKSRFEWGLMADIQLPDLEMRRAILQAKAEGQGTAVPEDVVEVIARHVHHNIRELEGALNKVLAYAHLSGGTIDVELAHMALSELVRRPGPLTVDQVIEAVCIHYHLPVEALTGSSRKRAIAFPRQVAMYLARMETEASLPQIGRKLGDRDHTTVLYGYEKIASLLETDEAARRDMMVVKAALYESTRARGPI